MHTRTYELVGAIRLRRLRWLGHFLRMPDVQLVKVVAKSQWDLGIVGNLFMDVSTDLTYDEV